MSLRWDGSYYGEIKRKDIIMTIKEGIRSIKLIKIKKEEVWCYVKRTDDDFVCFYDEIKPFFGLIKQGTHRIKINGNNYVICKYLDLKKVSIKYYEKYSDDITRILIFKRILCVSESLKDIYFMEGNILDLSYGKYICNNKMRDIFIKRFFPRDKDFEEFLFYEMIKKVYSDKLTCILKIEDKLTKISSHIEYSSIGIEEVAQKIGDFSDKLFT